MDGAVDWRIIGHETEAGKDVEIISVYPTVQGPYVAMKVWWSTQDFPEGETGFFTERDVQGKDEKLLLAYWKSEGGRTRATGLDPNIIHILKVLEEKIFNRKTNPTKKLRVQFVGHSAEKKDTRWWPAEEVEKAYVEVYEEWTFKKEKLDN
ncbi:hypothetical protein NW762_008344 [Fusarium torreyae]|uniref:Chromo domain-containing protein n=1 Tax=Fusarium torreyae TaxID=1237075 RepID=A0A9W8VCE9_9HYPO|nr:hypothetical protein NW762_008344 [Fusarium torreyae]